MSAGDVFAIVRVVAPWALSIGVITLLAQRFARRAPLWSQLVLVIVATIGVLVAGMMTAFNAMFISAHDLEVMWYIVAIATMMALIVSAILGLGLSRSSAKLVGIARSIGRGESIEPSAAMNAELATLATELERTSHSLAQSREREAAIESARRELVSWVSHDLRTPLASMKAMTEALQDGVAADVADYHQRIINQADQMAVMLSDLMELSKIQSGSLTITPQNVDLYDVVSDAIADLSPVAQRRNVAVDGTGVASTQIQADAPTVARAVRNLLLNAIAYTHPDSSIAVRVSADTAWAQISVRDQCGGIPASHLEHLFAAGWSNREGRSRDEFSGAGVGLSLVKGIAQAHGGSVSVANVDGGCAFTLTLPRVVHAERVAGAI